MMSSKFRSYSSKILAATAVLLFCAAALQAAHWQRSWDKQGTSAKIDIKAECLLLKNAGITPFRECEHANVRIIRKPLPGSKPFLLLPGEKEELYVFVIVVQDTEGSITNYGIKLAIVIPKEDAAPFVFKKEIGSATSATDNDYWKRNSDDPNDSLLALLQRNDLVPSDCDFDTWIYYYGDYFNSPGALKNFLTRRLYSSHKTIFTQTDQRVEGYLIPSTIEKGSLSLRISAQSVLSFSFSDPTLADPSLRSDQAKLLWTIEEKQKYLFVSRFKKAGEGSVALRAGPVHSIGISSTDLEKPFKENRDYRLSIRIHRRSYGSTRMRAVRKVFRFKPGFSEQADEDDPFDPLINR